MNKELNVKMDLDNSLYIESLKQIIDTTVIFRQEIQSVKDKLDELSSTKVQTQINVDAGKAINSIKAVNESLSKLRENSSVTIDIQKKAEKSDPIEDIKNDIEGIKELYKETLDLAGGSAKGNSKGKNSGKSKNTSSKKASSKSKKSTKKKSRVSPMQARRQVMNSMKSKSMSKKIGGSKGKAASSTGTLKKAKSSMKGILKSTNNTAQLKKSKGTFKKFFDYLGKGFKKIHDIAKKSSGGMLKSIKSVFSVISKNPVVAVIMLIIGAVALLYKAWTEDWGGIRSKFQPIIDVIKKALDSVSPIIDGIIEGVSKFLGLIKDAWEAVTGFLKNPIGKLGDFVGGLFGIGKNALGTKYWGGGLTWVGENGPELVNLPGGSQVFDNRTSNNMSGANINIPKLADSIVVREDADIDRIASSLARKLKNTGLNMA